MDVTADHSACDETSECPCRYDYDAIRREAEEDADRARRRLAWESTSGSDEDADRALAAYLYAEEQAEDLHEMRP
ncbi:hypothetical protein ACFY05_32935 [Microtetraspora fusca]|uniref:Uncharacterized protein n=1 Tax=Microtetraspora fusca TaxID=1997 RepID=A0ABW6VE69_MICFU